MKIAYKNIKEKAIKMNDLRQMVSMYLRTNGIKTKFFAQYIECDYARCVKCLKGEGKFTSGEIRKIYDFLDGKHLVPMDQIIKEGTVVED